MYAISVSIQFSNVVRKSLCNTAPEEGHEAETLSIKSPIKFSLELEIIVSQDKNLQIYSILQDRISDPPDKDSEEHCLRDLSQVY